MNCLYDSKTKEVIVGLRGCHVPLSHLHVSRAEVDVAHSFKFSPPNLQICFHAAKIISIILPHWNTANTHFFTMFSQMSYCSQFLLSVHIGLILHLHLFCIDVIKYLLCRK